MKNQILGAVHCDSEALYQSDGELLILQILIRSFTQLKEVKVFAEMGVTRFVSISAYFLG